MTLVQITAPYFCAALEYLEGGGGSCAPILKYMKWWNLDKIKAYCFKKGWKVEIIVTQC